MNQKKLDFQEGFFVPLVKMSALGRHLNFMANYHNISPETYLQKLLFEDMQAIKNRKKPILERAIEEFHKQVSKYIKG